MAFYRVGSGGSVKARGVFNRFVSNTSPNEVSSVVPVSGHYYIDFCCASDVDAHTVEVYKNGVKIDEFNTLPQGSAAYVNVIQKDYNLEKDDVFSIKRSYAYTFVIPSYVAV